MSWFVTGIINNRENNSKIANDFTGVYMNRKALAVILATKPVLQV
jgi:hypothetical protein